MRNVNLPWDFNKIVFLDIFRCQKYVKRKGIWKWQNGFTLCLFWVHQVTPLYTTCILGGGRPATAITIFDKTENTFKVTWQSNYQQSGELLHYIVSLYYNNIKIGRKETTYNFTPLLFNRNILSNTPYRITIQSRSPYDDEYGDVVDMPKGMHFRN